MDTLYIYKYLSVEQHVMYSSVPGACLQDQSIIICEYDETSYPASLVNTVLQTYQHEMRVLLKYARQTMLKTGAGLNNVTGHHAPESHGSFLCSGTHSSDWLTQHNTDP